MPQAARRLPAACISFSVTANPSYDLSILFFAFSNIRDRHIFSYTKGEGMPTCELDPRYHGEGPSLRQRSVSERPSC